MIRRAFKELTQNRAGHQQPGRDVPQPVLPPDDYDPPVMTLGV